MQTSKLWLLSFLMLFCTLAATQELYKYVDKDGKVTYTDRPPKPGEKAERVIIDPKANVADPYKPPSEASRQKSKETAEKNKRLDKQREQLTADLKAAQAALERAKNELEEGRQAVATDFETIQRKGAAPITIRKPDYEERVTKLEAAVKKAEEAVATAEDKLRKAE
ncbi:MAG: DUF4124 domain-containing protein [Betaproteobacteria bacterium]|nr:DUF4124 domain-containing protein [Betaproteobacteria bacterium]